MQSFFIDETIVTKSTIQLFQTKILEYDFFVSNQMEKEIKIFHRIWKIEFGKEILDFTKQCALS